MAGWTNKGKAEMLKQVYQRTTLPTNYYVALVTNAFVPGPDTNTFADLTEINAGNGYTAGGFSLTPGGTDFDFVEEDDTGDLGRIQIKDVTWTASGGPIPSSGTGAYYAILTDDNGTQSARIVFHYWDLTGPRSVQDGSPFTLIDLEIRMTET